MNPSDILQFIGIPVAVATGIMLASWWVLPSKRLQPIGSCMAVGLSCFAAFVLQEDLPSIPPNQKWHWLVITIMLVSLLACIYPLWKKWDKRIVLQAMIAGLIGAIVMQFPSQDGILDRFLVFILILFGCVGLRRLTIPPWHMYLASWMILASISMLALQGSFAKLAFFAGAMSAVAASLCVLQLVKPHETKSVQMIFGVSIVGSALCGLAYDPTHIVPSFAWFLPIVSIPLSAIAYFLCKGKYRAVLSLTIIALFVSGAVTYALFAAPAVDEMWP